MKTMKKWMGNRRSQKSREQRWVTSDAFFHGAHGIPEKDGIAEIKALHAEEEAELRKTSLAKQQLLEGRLEHLKGVTAAAKTRWAAIQQRLGDRTPHLVMPIIVAIIGASILVSEGLLLAPTMDVMSVTDPTWQIIAAFTIACFVATAFHFAWGGLTSETSTKNSRTSWRAMGALFGAGLVAWGVFRGYQVGYAASINQNPLGDFLSAHPLLASCFYVFVTIGISVVSATASHFSAIGLHTWWEWKTAKNLAESLTKEKATVTNELESERRCLSESLNALNAQCKQHLASYRQHYQRGKLCGAKQDPFWTVPLKATVAAGVTLIVLPFVPTIHSLAFLPPIAWAATFLYFWRRWQNPTASGYFDLEKVRFAEPAAPLSTPPRLLDAVAGPRKIERPKEITS